MDAIQFCVDLDIPLKHFHEYTDETAPWICYKDLVERGTGLVQEKIRIMQERLALLKTMQAEMERSEKSYQNNTPELYFLPERTCKISSYGGQLGTDESNEQMKKMIIEIYTHKMKVGNANGLLLLKENNNWKQYLFVDVDTASAKNISQPQYIHIPAGQYLCKRVEQSDINQVWNWCQPHLSAEQIKLVIETELFVGNYTFSKPALEQRCLLHDRQSAVSLGD